MIDCDDLILIGMLSGFWYNSVVSLKLDHYKKTAESVENAANSFASSAFFVVNLFPKENF